MVNNKQAKLRRLLKTNVIIGSLYMLPFIMSVFPDNLFRITHPFLPISLALMLWVAFMVWVARLRDIRRVDVIASVLLLASGQTGALLTLCYALGLGLLSVGIAPAVAFSLSRFSVNEIRNVLE